MSFDAYVWVDLEFPSEPKDSMTRWKQSALDGGKWSDWGGFGASAGPVAGFETVAAVLAQAARYAAKQRIEGKQFIFSVALGPTQVKVRAAFDKSQSQWWRALACMARAAAPLDAVGEFGWATAGGNGGRESYVASIAEGNSQFRTMSPEELRRLDRHPAVMELDAKRTELATAAPPVPLTLTAPTPRPPGSGRGYRRRGFGPRPAPVAVPVDVPPDEEALVGDGVLDEDAATAVDLEATTDTDADTDTGDHADGEGGGDDFGDEAPEPQKDEPPARGRARAAAKPAASKAAPKPAPKAPAKAAPEKAAKPARAKAPTKPAPAKKKPAKKK